MTIYLWIRFFYVDSPVRDLCMCFISKYVSNGEYIPATLMGRVIKLGLSPTRAALSYTKPTLHPKPLDGIVDSLKSVISSPDILSRGSSSHTLLKSLTKAEVIYFIVLCVIYQYVIIQCYCMFNIIYISSVIRVEYINK